MVGLIIAAGISVIVGIAILWVEGIDHMQEKHPDYKGEDFLDWENHTENEF